MANIERTPSTPGAIPNPTATANERATAESQTKTPCGAARRAVTASRTYAARAHDGGALAIDAEFRPLIEAAKEVWDSVPGTYERGPEVERHARALNALRAALRTIEED